MFSPLGTNIVVLCPADSNHNPFLSCFAVCLEEDPEELSRKLAIYRQSPLALDAKFIQLKQKLGDGFFGQVFLGTCFYLFSALQVLQ